MSNNSPQDNIQEKKLFVIKHDEQATQAALFAGNKLIQYFIETENKRSLIGNIYLGKVRRVVPNMQAVFVDIGLQETALLAARDVVPKTQQHSEEALADFFEGQKVWVQVRKDALPTKAGLNTKGVRVTTELSLETNNLVFFPNSSHISVSKKVVDNKQRQILKSALKHYVDANAITGGFIIRTVVDEFNDDVWLQDALVVWQQWQQVKQAQQKATKVGLVSSSSNLIDQLVSVANKENVHSLQGVASAAMYFDSSKVSYDVCADEKLQNQLTDLNLTNQLNKALAAVVEIPSGGSISFDATEALTVIDVNMGSAVNAGGDAYEINVNAAKLIAGQLLLRNIGGMVIIDFIRMANKKQRNQVVNLMQDLLETDSMKTHIYGFTRLGLFELTRERVGLCLNELMSAKLEC